MTISLKLIQHIAAFKSISMMPFWCNRFHKVRIICRHHPVEFLWGVQLIVDRHTVINIRDKVAIVNKSLYPRFNISKAFGSGKASAISLRAFS